ncbi:peroxiredoxin [Microbaculum marinum]|uniref:thioredoxin-dependent peroxiredoxin n=1 Tax=Microbaculum marinum TaxID=1764581 RepID=A0AAW9RX40_9HYPH
MSEEICEGSAAPDFDLPTDGGGKLCLSDLRGHAVVLYFYPKDDTTGCTREAIDFSRLKDDFEKAGAVVVGVSPDSPVRHDRFRAKHGLSVMLASDETKDVLQAYGVWKEKSMYGRKFMGVERSTFLIDNAGTVRQVWRKVKVSGHAEAVLRVAQSLGS